MAHGLQTDPEQPWLILWQILESFSTFLQSHLDINHLEMWPASHDMGLYLAIPFLNQQFELCAHLIAHSSVSSQLIFFSALGPATSRTSLI